MYSVRHPARRYDREYIAYPIFVFSLCVAGLICRCGSGWKHGGFCFFSFPAVSMISCPHPPAPLPGGKGAFSFLMQGASPLASPRPSRKRHGLHLRCGCPAGGLPGRSPARPTFSFICCPHPPSPPSPFGEGGVSKFISPGGFAPGTPALNRLRHLQTLPYRCPAGGLPGRSATRPTFSFISFPHPPAPFPLRGRGCPKVYFAGGFAPGTPALNRLRRLQTPPCRCPAGGLPGRSATDLAFSFISFPHPPPPSPPGKGESQSLFRRGLRPRHPCTEPPTALTDAAMQVPGGWLARQVGDSSYL